MQWTTRRELQIETILQGSSDFYDFYNPSPGLSIKTMRNGRALYYVDGGQFAVDDSSYLILNEHQPYHILIESNTVVDSFCVFFPRDWASDILCSMIVPADKLLSDPLAQDFQAWGFFERVNPHDDIVTPTLRHIHAGLQDESLTGGWLEDNLRLLLLQMLHVQFGLYRDAEQIPSARASTRIELYRRLYLARDYIHANLSRPVNLDEIAQVAHLSPYHFLRTFKQVFGQTPHEYLTQKRIERAQYLLTNTRQPVTDICLEVGFESLGSFSTLFQRRVGLSPRRYRKSQF